MILFKFTKVSYSKYLSYLDVSRSIFRTLNRMNLSINYSNGFNPHPIMYFSPPLSLGVESVCEYCVVDCIGISADDFIKKFNEKSSKDIQAIKAIEIEQNPNLSNIICAYKYRIEYPNITKEKKRIEDLFSQQEVSIKVSTKTGEKFKNLKEYLCDYCFTENEFDITLKNNEDGIKIQSVIESLFKDEYSIIKTQSYVLVGKKFIDADEYINL